MGSKRRDHNQCAINTRNREIQACKDINTCDDVRAALCGESYTDLCTLKLKHSHIEADLLKAVVTTFKMFKHILKLITTCQNEMSFLRIECKQCACGILS